MSIWYLFLEPHPTTYHSNIGVQLRRVTNLDMSTLNTEDFPFSYYEKGMGIWSIFVILIPFGSILHLKFFVPSTLICAIWSPTQIRRPMQITLGQYHIIKLLTFFSHLSTNHNETNSMYFVNIKANFEIVWNVIKLMLRLLQHQIWYEGDIDLNNDLATQNFFHLWCTTSINIWLVLQSWYWLGRLLGSIIDVL